MKYTIENEQLDDSLVYIERARACDNSKQATLLFLVALRIRESVLGLYHEDTAEVYYNLGWASYEHGDLDSAIIFFQQAWRISEHVYGKEHGVTLVILDDLRDALEEQGYEDLEIDTFCAQIFQSRSMSHQATESAQNGDTSKAIYFCQQALIALPPSSPNYQSLEAADIRRQLGSLLRKQGDAEEALADLCRSLLVYQSILGPKHPTTIHTRRLVQQVAQREVTPIGTVIPAAQNHPRWWKRNMSSLSSSSQEATMPPVSNE